MKTVKEIHYRIVNFESMRELREFLCAGGVAEFFPTGICTGMCIPVKIAHGRLMYLGDNTFNLVEKDDLDKIYGKIEL